MKTSSPPCAPDQRRWRVTLFLCTVWMTAHGLSGVAAQAQSRTSAPHQTNAEAASEHGPSGVVNINEANIDELMRLPGIGLRKAEAIVALRERLSGFKRLPQLMRVRGIGRKTFRRLHPWLALEGPTTFERGRPAR